MARPTGNPRGPTKEHAWRTESGLDPVFRYVRRPEDGDSRGWSPEVAPVEKCVTT